MPKVQSEEFTSLGLAVQSLVVVIGDILSFKATVVVLQQTVAGSDFDCKEGEDVGTGEHWWVVKELNGAFTPPFV